MARTKGDLREDEPLDLELVVQVPDVVEADLAAIVGGAVDEDLVGGSVVEATLVLELVRPDEAVGAERAAEERALVVDAAVQGEAVGLVEGVLEGFGLGRMVNGAAEAEAG